MHMQCFLAPDISQTALDLEIAQTVSCWLTVCRVGSPERIRAVGDEGVVLQYELRAAPSSTLTGQLSNVAHSGPQFPLL